MSALLSLSSFSHSVIAGLDPATQSDRAKEIVRRKLDGRVKPGHDADESLRQSVNRHSGAMRSVEPGTHKRVRFRTLDPGQSLRDFRDGEFFGHARVRRALLESCHGRARP